MADEEVENLPPKEEGGDEGGEKKSGGSPIVPILLVVILAPGLSFATTNFLLVPKIKAAMQEIVQVQQPEGQDKASAADEEAIKYTYDFENIIANLSGALHSRYIKISFTVEGTDPEFVEKAEANKAKIIDATLGALTSLSLKDLEQPGVRNMLRNDLLSAYENALNEELVEQLYFSEFVVQ